MLSMAALLETLYLTFPDAYLKDDAPAVGTTDTAGRETVEVGTGEVAGVELRDPTQPPANPERRYQHFLRFGIFMYSRSMFFGVSG